MPGLRRPSHETNLMSLEELACVDRMLRARRTEKVMASHAVALAWSSEELTKGDENVQSAIEIAGFAPFHYPLGANGAVEPWRVHWLKQPDASRLADRVRSSEALSKEAGKIPALLWACGSLVLVCEQPDQALADEKKRAAVNREHLMAVSAYSQSLLLALQARGLGSYWSSGGVLNSSTVMQWLGIPANQLLVAAIFVDYRLPFPEGSVERVPGKLRESRTTVENWTRTIELANL